MFLARLDCNRQIPLNDVNLKQRDHFSDGPEMELEWDVENEVITIKRIVRPFGFDKPREGDQQLDEKKLAAREKKERAAAPRKVLAIVPMVGCSWWPLE